MYGCTVVKAVCRIFMVSEDRDLELFFRRSGKGDDGTVMKDESFIEVRKT